MIRFLDLYKLNKPFEVEFQQKFQQFLKNGWYILGEEVERFETHFAQYCKVNHCIGVGNGLDAITLIFKAYIEQGKLQKGDEVMVPANTFIASIIAVLNAELIPVFVEPKLETYTMDADLIEEKITPKTKAILPVHLYGQMCEMDKIHTMAEKYGLLVVEDAAQAHGATFCNNPQSTIAYRFYPGKNLGALGDGGAVVTNNFKLAETIKKLRNYGSEQKYKNQYIGINSRLDELQAAFLNIKLPYLNAENEARRAIAKRYLSEIKNKKIVLPFWDESRNHAFHLFVIRTQNRDQLQRHFTENNIETQIHYPIPPHKQKALERWKSLSLPITEKIHQEVLSLPIYSTLTQAEVSKIISVANTF
ncbi:MAG: DegT/DnrJ/EryC1/StrS family aminotransferase [Aestuariibaculum sp.]